MNGSDALNLVKTTVEGMSTSLGYPTLASVSAQTELFGGSTGVDSLSVVQIIAEVERAAREKYGRSIVLADERAMSRRSSPYRTVGTIAELLEERLGE